VSDPLITDTGAGAGIGAAVGGPPGALIGAGIGAAAGLLQDIFGGQQSAEDAQRAAEHTAAKSVVSTYQTYLDQFPAYAAAKEGEYQTQEAQTLGDRLAAMGVRGQTSGGAGPATSAGSFYTAQKSLFDTGYQQLVQSLNLEETKAQNQLKAAQAAADATRGRTSGLFGHGGFLGLGIG